MKGDSNKKMGILLVAGIIIAAIFSRIIPHPMNYTPLGAIALFGGAYFNRKWLAFLVPVAAFWASDFILNNTVYAAYYEGLAFFTFIQAFTIGAIVLIALFSLKALKKITALSVLGSAVVASILFFLVTNFGTWIQPMPMYPANAAGLIACYVAGLPFLASTLASNVLFSALLFGAYEYITNKKPSLKLIPSIG